MQQTNDIDTYFAKGFYPDGSAYHEQCDDMDYLLSRRKEFPFWKLFVRLNDGTETNIKKLNKLKIK